MDGTEYCAGYCGVACVNGYCPASIDTASYFYAGNPCKVCRYYFGCVDCAFVNTPRALNMEGGLGMPNSNEYLCNAVRRINIAIKAMSKELESYTGDRVTWGVHPFEDTIDLTLAIGKYDVMRRTYSCADIAAQSVGTTNDLICDFYFEYIKQYPELQRCRFASVTYAQIAQMCGARSDIVSQVSIKKDTQDIDFYTVTLRSYNNVMIQRTFSRNVIEDGMSEDFIKRIIRQMIRSLEEQSRE